MPEINPQHIALILDGNKRWAKKNNLSKKEGYFQGFENIKTIIDYAIKIKLSNLTLFTLSSENIKRPSINIIYNIIYDNFSKLIQQLIDKKNIRIKVFGSKNNLPDKVLNIIENAETITKNNKSLNLNLAFNYGFKEEIKDVLKKFKNNTNLIDLNNDDDIKNLFYLGRITDPDILIRTGGHHRLSNFIMYNLTYTELFFTDSLWPDFSVIELKDIIKQFHEINRKYGL